MFSLKTNSKNIENFKYMNSEIQPKGHMKNTTVRGRKTETWMSTDKTTGKQWKLT